MGRGKATSTTRVLFTGIGQRGGEKRASFVEEMRRQYGHKFLHIQGGIHGRELADKIAGANVVLAPDAPVTDHYWSNRVYLSLGFGAFMLHPWCERLTHHYAPAKDIVYYRNRDELHGKIEYYLARPKERERIAASGLERTKAEHTYLARCKELLRVVAERL